MAKSDTDGLRRRGVAGSDGKVTAEKKDSDDSEGKKLQTAQAVDWRLKAVACLAGILVLLTVLAVRNPNAGSGKMKPVQRQRQPEAEVWVPASVEVPAPMQFNVTCSAKAGGDGTGATGLCGNPRRSNGCARFVLDGAIPREKVEILRGMIQWLVDEAWGAGAGPPSVIDLHAETISYKEKFVNLTALMEFKSLNFSQAQVEAYQSVRESLRQRLSEFFGVPIEGLQHDMTFFSHINASKEAKNIHDEYWHTHIDTDQYGTFAYTTLLYLNTQDEDFEGGEFIFEPVVEGDKLRRGAAVEPRFGRVVAFTSDAENPHKVLKVTRGTRLALTAAFTCSREKAASIEPFPKTPQIEAVEPMEAEA